MAGHVEALMLRYDRTTFFGIAGLGQLHGPDTVFEGVVARVGEATQSIFAAWVGTREGVSILHFIPRETPGASHRKIISLEYPFLREAVFFAQVHQVNATGETESTQCSISISGQCPPFNRGRFYYLKVMRNPEGNFTGTWTMGWATDLLEPPVILDMRPPKDWVKTLMVSAIPQIAQVLPNQALQFSHFSIVELIARLTDLEEQAEALVNRSLVHLSIHQPVTWDQVLVRLRALAELQALINQLTSEINRKTHRMLNNP